MGSTDLFTQSFDRNHSTYKWGNYISDNLTFGDNRKLDINNINSDVFGDYFDDNPVVPNKYLKDLNFSLINEDQIRSIFNTVLHSEKDNYYIGINILNKLNYSSLENNVDKQLLYSIFNAENVTPDNSILFNNDKIVFSKNTNGSFNIPLIGLDNIIQKDITLTNDEKEHTYYEINSENYEIIHEQNYMEGYLVEDLEHIDLIKEFIKDNDNLVEKYNQLYVDIIKTMNSHLKKNIEYTIFIIKIPNERNYIIENTFLHTKLIDKTGYDYLLDKNELLFTVISDEKDFYNTSLTLNTLVNDYKILYTEYDSINSALQTKYGEYYIRSGVNDLMKNLDIREGFQNNRSHLSIILILCICLLFYLVLKE